MMGRYMDFLLDLPAPIGFTLFVASCVVGLILAVVAILIVGALVATYPITLPLFAAIPAAWLGYCVFYAVRRAWTGNKQ